MPLYRTYSNAPFSIGDVEFNPITKELLDSWFSNRVSQEPEMERRIKELDNRTRASYQATLAACVKVKAEKDKAAKIALEKAVTATALLRFLCSANWTHKMKSYTQPMGLENQLGWHSFHLVDGKITSLSSQSIDEGPQLWVVDDIRTQIPGLVETISDLALSHHQGLRRNIFDAMLIYSRNSITADPSDKLVFILVALESIFLRDSSEPIQGNLAERIALLIGGSFPQRKEIVAVVKKAYGMRSKFLHHGLEMDDLTVFDQFLLHAWSTFLKLLQLRDQFPTRIDLLNYLDEKKLS